jgi:polygalacturonase
MMGWSAPVALTITSPAGWSGKIFNVKRYGATGNGRTDDQSAIRAAVAAAETVPNSTVFFPAGKYLVNGGLFGLQDIRLLGQGMGATTILAGPAYAGGSGFECLIESPTHNVEFANLGFSANGNMQGDLPMLVYARQSTDLRFTNVRFDALGIEPADIHAAHRVTFSGCQIVGKAI